MSATKQKTLKQEKDKVVSSNSAIKNFGLRKRTKGSEEKKSETKKNKVDPIPTPIPPTEFEVEQIVGKQIVSDIVFYQVKWKGFSLEETTWEPEDNLENAPMKIRDYENLLLEKKKSEKKTPHKKDIIKAASEPQKVLGKRSKAKEEEEEDDDDDVKDGDISKKLKTNSNLTPEQKKRGRPKKQDATETTPMLKVSKNGNIFRLTKPASDYDLGSLEEERKEVVGKKTKKNQEGDGEKLLEEQKSVLKETTPGIGNQIQDVSDELRAETPNTVSIVEKEKMSDSGILKTPRPHLKIHRNVNEYGSFAKGDTPVKVIGVRHTKEKPDLEVMVGWKLRDDGSQPINSKVSRLDLLQKGFWLPLLQFYESKMKMENSPDFNPESLPKM